MGVEQRRACLLGSIASLGREARCSVRNASVRLVQVDDSQTDAWGVTCSGLGPSQHFEDDAGSAQCALGRVPDVQWGVTVEESLSLNVQRETTFPQGMSRRQAAPAMPPGAEA